MKKQWGKMCFVLIVKKCKVQNQKSGINSDWFSFSFSTVTRYVGTKISWDWWNWERSTQFSTNIPKGQRDGQGFKLPLVAEIVFTCTHASLKFLLQKTGGWPRRDLNTQPSDLESDALPLRHEVTYSSVFVWRFPCYYTVMNKKMCRDVYLGLKRLVISDLQPEQLMR